MANTFLNINMITYEAVRLWRNSNAFIRNIDQQYDDQFARSGAKIGSSLRIRLPVDFTTRTGAAAQPQDISEQSISLVLATQQGVDWSASTLDRSLSMDNFADRYLAPAVNVMAGAVASNIMNGSEGGICNLVQNTDSNGNIISPTQNTFLAAKASLAKNSAPQGRRKVVNSPDTMSRTVASLSGLLNPMADISRQYATGTMYQGLGFDSWMEDPTVINHTSGSFSAGTVNGASQTGSTVTVNAITGTLTQGDIITFASVDGVNRITKQDTGELRQFVVTAPVANGATSIPIYPAIVPPVSGQQVQYQTVTASPANGAAITLVTPASTTYRKNFCYVPDAITMATADLYVPEAVEESARAVHDNIAMRMLTGYLPGTDQLLTRLDILYGWLYIRPEWSVIIADSI